MITQQIFSGEKNQVILKNIENYKKQGEIQKLQRFYS
jgi:hypothetical protein